MPALRQTSARSPDSPLHRERHLDTSERVLLDAARLGIAEKHDDGVAHIFIDCRAVFGSDPRHLRQVVVEELRQILRFHLVRDLGEIGDVGEAHGELLPLARDLNVLAPGEDRIVDLGCEIFRKLARKGLQGRGFLGEVGLTAASAQ